MNAAEQLVERLLGNIQEQGSGIFVKHLRNGDIFTCKCPECGTLHGGYRSFEDAKNHLKCRHCYRTEIEKLKKDVEKVDEPKPQKNIFQHPLNKRAVIEGEEDEEEEDVKSILGWMPLEPDYPQEPGEVTKSVCEQAHHGQEFYSRSEFNRDGYPKRVRVSGKCKTWRTRPNEYRLPVKFGLYQSLYITHANAGDWSSIPLDSGGRPIL